MKAVKGIYEEGKVTLLEKPKTKGKIEVRVLSPDKEGYVLKVVGNNPDELGKLCGIVSLGGNAVLDTENIYE